MQLKDLQAYEILEKRPIKDLNSEGIILRHKKSGARIAVISNDDDNKVFYIGFRTPPEDSTGVAHIIEHTVLCGSDKYPVKDPFVELVKGSLNTFLNAMTYPEKTIYPVASCNDKDFQNLMSVYMDAVFHPNIYKYQEIFQQEGWHYELESEDAPVTINGVVYNEMKGAFSSPDDVLSRQIMTSLFPDTTYANVSGGDPLHIPELTYEEYLDFHRRYYHPCNSYIYLYGDMDVAIPRDRNGDYEPQLIKKYQNTVTQDMEEKILSMYAKGMTTGDIESHMRELYDIDISDSTISRITDKILPIVKEWQERPLEEVYAVVFMDAIHYHVRSEGRIVKRAVYIALGIDMNGKKDVLGMYVGENESAKFWLSIMNGLKNRGVEDILIACVDGLNGFPQAIEAVYPKTEIQQCIIHQIRNSTKFVSYKDIKKLMADLKLVYAAPTEETALNELELFKDKWDSKYPKIHKSWNDNWATLSTYFKYPEAVRRLIYTTNAIEGFNRQLRKVTKSKAVFPSDDSLLKMLYLATMDITKKWTGHRQDWGQIHSQLEIYFEERLIGRIQAFFP